MHALSSKDAKALPTVLPAFREKLSHFEMILIGAAYRFFHFNVFADDVDLESSKGEISKWLRSCGNTKIYGICRKTAAKIGGAPPTPGVIDFSDVSPSLEGKTNVRDSSSIVQKKSDDTWDFCKYGRHRFSTQNQRRGEAKASISSVVSREAIEIAPSHVGSRPEDEDVETISATSGRARRRSIFPEAATQGQEYPALSRTLHWEDRGYQSFEIPRVRLLGEDETCESRASVNADEFKPTPDVRRGHQRQIPWRRGSPSMVDDRGTSIGGGHQRKTYGNTRACGLNSPLSGGELGVSCAGSAEKTGKMGAQDATEGAKPDVYRVRRWTTESCQGNTNDGTRGSVAAVAVKTAPRCDVGGFSGRYCQRNTGALVTDDGVNTGNMAHSNMKCLPLGRLVTSTAAVGGIVAGAPARTAGGEEVEWGESERLEERWKRSALDIADLLTKLPLTKMKIVVGECDAYSAMLNIAMESVCRRCSVMNRRMQHNTSRRIENLVRVTRSFPIA